MDKYPKEEDDTYTRDPPACRGCKKAYKEFVSSYSDADITYIHVDKVILTDKDRKDEKQTFIGYFKARVCALRNSKGGSLLVHLEGQTQDDRCLEKFDEAVERPLKSLITDGSLFTDNYKRQWLSALDEQHMQDFYDIVVLTVTKSNTICTANYNTKVTSDLELESPTLENLYCILQQRATSSQHVSRYCTDLYESRHLQCKLYRDSVDSDINEVCEKIWKECRLREYVTAMSNVEKGGSVFIGVKEEQTGTSKIYQKIGFILPKTRESDLKSALQNKLRETVVQLTNHNREFTEASLDDIQIRFHRLSDKRVVLEISVGRKEGVLFYSKGPTAYEIVRENGNPIIKKMSKPTWIEKLLAV